MLDFEDFDFEDFEFEEAVGVEAVLGFTLDADGCFAVEVGFEVGVGLGLTAVDGLAVGGSVSFFAVVLSSLRGCLVVGVSVLVVGAVLVAVVVALVVVVGVVEVEVVGGGVVVVAGVVCTHLSSLHSPSNKSLQWNNCSEGKRAALGTTVGI